MAEECVEPFYKLLDVLMNDFLMKLKSATPTTVFKIKYYMVQPKDELISYLHAEAWQLENNEMSLFSIRKLLCFCKSSILYG